MKRSLAAACWMLALLAANPAYAQQQGLQQAIKAYVSKQGPLGAKPTQVMADLDGDGRPEAIVTFCVDESAPGGKMEGANNPASVHCTLAVFKQTKDRWAFVAKIDLGQGELREIKGGKIKVETLTYSPNDPLCCPSQKRVAAFELKGGKLIPAR